MERFKEEVSTTMLVGSRISYSIDTLRDEEPTKKELKILLKHFKKLMKKQLKNAPRQTIYKDWYENDLLKF